MNKIHRGDPKKDVCCCVDLTLCSRLCVTVVLHEETLQNGGAAREIRKLSQGKS